MAEAERLERPRGCPRLASNQVSYRSATLPWSGIRESNSSGQLGRLEPSRSANPAITATASTHHHGPLPVRRRRGSPPPLAPCPGWLRTVNIPWVPYGGIEPLASTRLHGCGLEDRRRDHRARGDRLRDRTSQGRFWRPAWSQTVGQTQRPQNLFPAASVSLLNFPVASYMLPPPRTKTAGRYACGRPSVKVSMDSSTHQDRRGCPNGAIVCCDCLVNARVTTSKAPLGNCRVRLPPDHSSCQDGKFVPNPAASFLL